jgi:hypothetical protein
MLSIRFASAIETTIAAAAAIERACPTVLTDTPRSAAIAATVGERTTSSACDAIVASMSGASRARRLTCR